MALMTFEQINKLADEVHSAAVHEFGNCQTFTRSDVTWVCQRHASALNVPVADRRYVITRALSNFGYGS